MLGCRIDIALDFINYYFIDLIKYIIIAILSFETFGYVTQYVRHRTARKTFPNILFPFLNVYLSPPPPQSPSRLAKRERWQLRVLQGDFLFFCFFFFFFPSFFCHPLIKTLVFH